MKPVFTALATILTLGLVVFWVAQGYEYDNQIDSLLNRAQVAADRDDMVEYLTELKVNMEQHGMTRGHTAILWKTPANDMALHYKTINRILERLDQIKSLPKNETAYQVALDDIRGTIRELPNPGQMWLWTHYIWWMLLAVFIIWIVTGIAWLFSSDQKGYGYR